MATHFFPNVPFGWAFLGCLAVVMAVASILDLRFTVIPKALSLAGFGLGVLANIIRGAWLGQSGQRVWWFSETNVGLGAFDGFLFAVTGFALGFALFFVLWILGVCGGGDVKLFAALGSWVGPRWTLYILAVTLILLSAVVIVQAFVSVATGRFKPHKAKSKSSGKRRLITFALPLTIAAAIVLTWTLREELQLLPKQPGAIGYLGDRYVHA